MVNPLSAFLLGFVPAAVLAGLLAAVACLWRRTHYAVHAFLAGAVGASFAALLLLGLFRQATVFMGESLQLTLIWLVYGPVAEEVIKLGFLAGLFLWALFRDGKGQENWALCGALIGFGFAGAEGFVLLFGDPGREWSFEFLLTRWLGTAQMHALATALVGWMLVRGQRSGSGLPVLHLGVGLVLAVTLHGLWNCMAGGLYVTGVPALRTHYAVLAGSILFAGTLGIVAWAELFLRKKEKDMYLSSSYQ